VAAHKQPNESKSAQQKGWHEFRFFRAIRIRVNGLLADRVMANDKVFQPQLCRRLER
jgi:hypothetical protein